MAAVEHSKYTSHNSGLGNGGLPEEGSTGRLANGGVMAAVGGGSHVVDQGDQAVLQAHPRLVRPSGKEANN
jgi:hypothetical protein